MKAEKNNPGINVRELSQKKRGRHTILPEELMQKTIDIVKALRTKGAPVSYSVINSVAKGVVISTDR